MVASVMAGIALGPGARRKTVARTAEVLGVGCDEIGARIAREDRHLRGQELRFPEVVAVQQREELAGRHPHGGVPRRRQPAVRLRDDPHALGVQPPDLFRDLTGRIGRPVVHDDQLEVGIRLCQRGRGSVGQGTARRWTRHDHADGWHA